MKNQNEEVFKDVPGYEGLYQVSNLGRIENLRFGNGTILKKRVNSRGYLQVSLWKFKKAKRFKTHQLVAITFLNHTPDGNTTAVNHIDNNKLNNNLNNLQLITHREYLLKKRGVRFNKESNKWEVIITTKKKKIYVGFFNTEIEALNAYQNTLKTL